MGGRARNLILVACLKGVRGKEIQPKILLPIYFTTDYLGACHDATNR